MTKVTKTASHRGPVTLTLNAKGHGKLSTKIRLTFTPTRGRKLAAAITARFR